VAIAQSPRKDFFPGQLVKERKWENLGGMFKETRWDKMEGKNFLNKMELLMASLTSS
jgi:mediator of RNA polymerase II transcription subunit 17